MEKTSLSQRYWEAPTKLNEGYLEKKPEQVVAVQHPLVPQIRNGKIIGWVPY